jgi:hypothetical protein
VTALSTVKNSALSKFVEYFLDQTKAFDIILNLFFSENSDNYLRKVADDFARSFSSTTRKLSITLQRDPSFQQISDFVHAALNNRYFSSMQSDASRAIVSLRTFATSCGKDSHQLNSATDTTLRLRSNFLTETRKHLSDLSTKQPTKENAKKEIAYITSALSTLQAISALDLTALQSRTSFFPSLSEEISQRTIEYADLEENLTAALADQHAYLEGQSFRFHWKDFATSPLE